jgi:spermidine dehydrogenase
MSVQSQGWTSPKLTSIRYGDPRYEIAYVRGEQVFSVKARACVLASYNMMIPYLCPGMPATQKAALHRLVKTPLIYPSVALRNWTAFQKLGVAEVNSDAGAAAYTDCAIDQAHRAVGELLAVGV